MTEVQNATEILRKHQATQLSDELTFFHQHKREWVAEHRGEFILVGKHTFGGFHKTHTEAMKAGIRLFGPVSPVLIEQILEEGI
jgi:hypothetical protein